MQYEYTLTEASLFLGRENFTPSVVEPEDDSPYYYWELVGTCCNSERIFWTWRRKKD
jgi:hypothetical protein